MKRSKKSFGQTVFVVVSREECDDYGEDKIHGIYEDREDARRAARSVAQNQCEDIQQGDSDVEVDDVYDVWVQTSPDLFQFQPTETDHPTMRSVAVQEHAVVQRASKPKKTKK